MRVAPESRVRMVGPERTDESWLLHILTAISARSVRLAPPDHLDFLDPRENVVQMGKLATGLQETKCTGKEYRKVW